MVLVEGYLNFCYPSIGLMADIISILQFFPYFIVLQQAAQVLSDHQDKIYHIFSWILWFISHLLSLLLKSERPHPECVSFLYPTYAFPLSEQVYILSSLLVEIIIVYHNDLKKKVTRIIIMLIIPPLYYFSGTCTLTQAISTFVYSIITTYTFIQLVYVFKHIFRDEEFIEEK